MYRSRRRPSIGAPPRQDLLATSLAILDLQTHPEALEAYPFGAFGQVIFPSSSASHLPQPGHLALRLAYGVLAARRRTGAAFDTGLDSLIQGPPEPLEHGEPRIGHGRQLGRGGDDPVVNSRHQLWSVAGFLGAVAHGVFGLAGDEGSLSARPVLPVATGSRRARPSPSET